MAITVTQLVAFLEVTRRGSVTTAAAALGVTQPSVSSAVTALSRELGCELFERAGRGMQPTAAGREFAAYARDVVGLLDAGRQAAREAATRAGRELRITAVTSAAESFVPALLQRYGAEHPHVRLSLTVANPQTVLLAVAEHESDVAIVGRMPHDPGLTAAALGRNELVCVAAATDALSGRRALLAEALADRVWLLREPGSGTRLLAEQFLAERELAPATLTLGSNAAIKQAIRAGLGVALLSRAIVAQELEEGALATLRLSDGPGLQHWFAVHSAVGPLRPLVAGFVEFARTSAGRR